jgi:hypothetical protein
VTDRTDRGYPYPECDPPLTKDASDISQMRDLAQAVNSDAAAQDARMVQLIEKPDAVRVAFAASLVVTKSSAGDAIFIIPYSSTTYAQPAAFADLTAFGLRVQERGYYWVTSTVRCTNAGLAGMQIRHLRNGLARTEGRRFEGPAWPVIASESSMQTADLMYANAGDLIRTQVKMSPADGTYAFEARLAAIQILPLDI